MPEFMLGMITLIFIILIIGMYFDEALRSVVITMIAFFALAYGLGHLIKLMFI